MAPHRYLVEHLTRYRYDAPVEAVYNRGFVRPRDTESQLVLDSELVVSPQPDQVTEHLDYFGNHSTYLETRAPHTEFQVTCRSTVEVDWPVPDLNGFNRHTVAEAARELAADTDPLLLADFTMPSPLVAIGARCAGTRPRCWTRAVRWGTRWSRCTPGSTTTSSTGRAPPR